MRRGKRRKQPTTGSEGRLKAFLPMLISKARLPRMRALVLVPELRKGLYACLILTSTATEIFLAGSGFLKFDWTAVLQESSLPKQNVIASFLEGGRHETQGVHQPCRWCGDSVAVDCAGADSKGGRVRHQCRSGHRPVYRQLRSKERSPDCR